MTAAQFEQQEAPEVEAVLRWRFEELVTSRLRPGKRDDPREPCRGRPPPRDIAARAGLPGRHRDAHLLYERRIPRPSDAYAPRGVMSHPPDCGKTPSLLISCGYKGNEMTAAQFELLEANQAEEILRARFESLVWHGCPPGNALVIASHMELEFLDAIRSPPAWTAPPTSWSRFSNRDRIEIPSPG